MSKRTRVKKTTVRRTTARVAGRASFSETILRANRRAHEQANRRSGRRGMQSVHAAIAMAEEDGERNHGDWLKRPLR